MSINAEANDICIVFGICDDLGKITEIDLEGQRNTASVVHTTPRVPRISLSLDLVLMQLNISQVVLR